MLKNGTAVKLLTGYLVEALKENGIVTYDLDGIRDAFATLVPRLSKMALKYPGTTMTLLANLLVIMSAHFGESCLAWMRCLSDTYMTNKQRVSYAGLFDDVAASAWYAPGVDYVKYGRLMYGTGNNLFQPDAQMTRAMFVQVLYALEGSPSVSGLSCLLTDVLRVASVHRRRHLGIQCGRGSRRVGNGICAERAADTRADGDDALRLRKPQRAAHRRRGRAVPLSGSGERVGLGAGGNGMGRERRHRLRHVPHHALAAEDRHARRGRDRGDGILRTVNRTNQSASSPERFLRGRDTLLSDHAAFAAASRRGSWRARPA